MDKKILETIGAMPGCRQREIASAIGVWQCNSIFMGCLHNLEDLGFVYRENYSDPANMEYFYKWYLTDKGKYAIMNTENREGDFANG